MTIQRSEVLYLDNGTTVDTGAGIDIRWLDSATGAADATQSVRWTHTQDGQNRTFDPATALVTVTADPLTLQMEGWALRLTEDMTPTDDTNCNAMLNSGTVAIAVEPNLNANGGTNVGGVNTINVKCALFRYHLADNTGTLIASGNANQTWDTTAVGAQNNTYRAVTINISVASTVEFLQGEILLLQVGASATTLVDATLGTTNYDLTLRIGDTTNTKLTFASGQSIHQLCRFTNSPIARGGVTRQFVTALPRSVIGRGTVTPTKAVVAAKTFSLNGKGTTTVSRTVGIPRNLTARGTLVFSRVVVATKTINVVAAATLSHIKALAMTRSVIARGVVAHTRLTVAAKTFALTVRGTVTYTRLTVATKTFALITRGTLSNQKVVAIPRNIIGIGTLTYTRVTVAAKVFSLVARGVVSHTKDLAMVRSITAFGTLAFTKFTTVHRNFTMQAQGKILTDGASASTVTVPIDELPAEGGTTTIIKRPTYIFDD